MNQFLYTVVYLLSDPQRKQTVYCADWESGRVIKRLCYETSYWISIM
uniref:Uncharacterized protein n=1 Tax=Anguilla anguilla TaxID=7936 RepID=A0A0E9PJ20_ANGAN